MSRLSATLSDDQSDWVEEKADEFGISKGKVLRECIDHVRTGSSLFTTTMNKDKLDISERLSDIEARLDEVESSSESGSDASSTPTSPQGRDSVVENNGPDTHSMNKTPSRDGSDHDQSLSNSPAHESDVGSPGGEVRANSSTADSATTRSDAESPPTTVSVESEQGETVSTERDTSISNNSSGNESDDSQTTTTSAIESRNSDEMEGRQSSDGPPEEPDRDEVGEYLTNSLDSADRASVINDCWSKLERRGTMHTREFKDLHDEATLGRESPDVWWTEDIRPVLDSLPGVEPPEGSGSFYRFKYPEN